MITKSFANQEAREVRSQTWPLGDSQSMQDPRVIHSQTKLLKALGTCALVWLWMVYGPGLTADRLESITECKSPIHRNSS